MAVKASAAVTLSAIVDVQAVWKFYLKQSSTLTAPSKPTTFPPSSAWDDTEPTYDPTKTETLYVVDCNVFSDGTFEYTEVSISTAFEAAKAAYNKAVNAETAANDAASSADRNASDIVELASNAFTEIAKSQDSVLSTVSEQYYLKQDAERLVSEVSTQIEQTNEDVVIRFNQFNAELEGIVNGTDAEFEQIKKYIRFIDGRIHLGEIGNELELQIRNDRISFIQNGAEVAYLSNNKLYVVDGEFTNSLRLGNFAFTPRANGNLSFKKVGV